MRPRAARVGLLAAGLAVATLVTFAPVLGNGFVDWDDRILLLDNTAYRGLGWPQLRWMSRSVLLGHYVPMTWLSFGLDYALWGLNPAGYHLTNLLIHTANTLLLFWLGRRLFARATAWPTTTRDLAAAVAALFFAIHPLRVETVAWVTERRGVFSGFFFLLTVLMYLRASEAAGARRRWLLAASAGAYVFALMAKETVMTVPAVLVLLDVYPLRRLPGDPRRWFTRTRRDVWLEKVPFALLGAADAVIAYVSQAAGSGTTRLGLTAWLGLAAQSLWFQVTATVLPSGLSPLYELPPRVDVLALRALASLAAVVGLTVALLWWRRAWPAGLAAWVYLGLMMAPVTAPTHAGPQLTADRYSYLAALGGALLVGAAAGVLREWTVRGLLRRSLVRLSAAAAAAAFLGLAVLSWQQAHVWRDTLSLWQQAVAVSPECGRCRNALAGELMDHGRYQAALAQLEWMLSHGTDRPWLHGDLGLVLASLGRFREAITHYEIELDRHPDAVNVRTNLATALMRVGRPEDAVAQIKDAVHAGKPGAAAAYFRQGLRSADPTIAHLGLMEAYWAAGERGPARAHYQSLRRLNPALAAVAGAPLGL